MSDDEQTAKVAVTKYHATTDQIVDGGVECPLPLKVIPNYMGINLVSVSGVSWERQADGQLVSLKIHLKPSTKNFEGEESLNERRGHGAKN